MRKTTLYNGLSVISLGIDCSTHSCTFVVDVVFSHVFSVQQCLCVSDVYDNSTIACVNDEEGDVFLEFRDGGCRNRELRLTSANNTRHATSNRAISATSLLMVINWRYD